MEKTGLVLKDLQKITSARGTQNEMQILELDIHLYVCSLFSHSELAYFRRIDVSSDSCIVLVVLWL